ncbi:bifunctional thiamine biosynthesis protein ThiDN [Candidatus Methanoplasma termitum]|uniref:ThiDN protein n=1 Tax=Candidatus Methanoplasma termitum TaxID=1577791 RepID=A0A0A7LB36_9ARCH|nr:bifunctional hydroxymethylpyrimidine kinase/phosphomethylpyrimidine kinase [Candidatus Methanoplasma termitum]AIZ56213.1 bifunctional thiamine biosynthesis protein ThiDN [Candidatus Methanoplasma termitum]MCL2334399.1 bifunctional hydroxymethylpyrimidine kinase/phosphomethylpyrimidine kinase [Candidatus Methanoplasma sp.]
MKTALTIAGSDSVGGAGIQADIKAMASVGVHAATVITAVTVQNTREVGSILPIPEEIIKEQLEAVLKDCKINAIKTGMLYSADIVGVVADVLEDHEMPLIIDPVMVATVGSSLSKDDLVKSLKKDLLPMCELVTPNKFEAEALSGMKIKNEDDAMLACELIGKQGSSVLLKGGHMDSRNVVDYLYLSSEFTKMSKPRLNKAGHGSGCVLSSYITANMAMGLDLVNSVLRSRELIQRSIETQYEIGKGELIVNPMASFSPSNEKSSAKFDVLDSIDAAAEKLVNVLPSNLVPKKGVNIAYATKGAAGPEDVAGIDQRITLKNGRLVKNGPAKFGAAGHLSFILLEIMKKDPSMRCIISIAPAGDTLDLLEEVGMNTVLSGRKGNPMWGAATKELLGKTKVVPDAIYDTDQKNGKTIKMLGKDPQEVLSKLSSILN